MTKYPFLNATDLFDAYNKQNTYKIYNVQEISQKRSQQVIAMNVMQVVPFKLISFWNGQLKISHLLHKNNLSARNPNELP